MATAKKAKEDFDNACHLLIAVLKATPPQMHPKPPFHGGGRAPKIDAESYVHVTLWLASQIEKWVDARDRAEFDDWLALTRRRLALPAKEKPSNADAQRLISADAKKASRVPLKVAVWSAHEANNWSTRPIYAGGAARPAAANIARFLVKKDPEQAKRFVAAANQRCLHFEALGSLRDRNLVPTSPPVETPWRGTKADDAPTHWLMLLENGAYALLFKEKTRWRLVEGMRDDVLANVEESQFEAAVNAAVKHARTR